MRRHNEEMSMKVELVRHLAANRSPNWGNCAEASSWACLEGIYWTAGGGEHESQVLGGAIRLLQTTDQTQRRARHVQDRQHVASRDRRPEYLPHQERH